MKKRRSMLGKGKYRRLLPALMIATLIFIWGNSLMPASASSAFSNWVRSVIAWFFGGGGSEGAAIGEGPLRKIAHMTEFAALGAEALLWQRHRVRQALPAVFLGGVTVAVIDETLQLFSEGRASQVVDVWIDTAGFACGVAVVLLILRWRKKKDESH